MYVIRILLSMPWNFKFSPLPTAEEDFSIVIMILEFHSGDTYIDVNVTIINDESIEGNETFTIYLTSDVGSTYIETEITIIDDDYDDDVGSTYIETEITIIDDDYDDGKDYMKSL